MGTKGCVILNQNLKNFAKDMKMSEELVAIKAGSWMDYYNESELPTQKALKEFLETVDKENKPTVDSNPNSPVNLPDSTEILGESKAADKEKESKSEEKGEQSIKGVAVTVCDTTSYKKRTIYNIEHSDITLAIADDFNTGGELITAKSAGAKVRSEEQKGIRGKYIKAVELLDDTGGEGEQKYVSCPITDAEDMADNIINKIKSRPELKQKDIKLNIAGNSTVSLDQDQKYYDDLVTKVVQILIKKGVDIAEIRSGGQTGIDEAGIKAAIALGIPAKMAFTKDYKFRVKDESSKKGYKDIRDEDLFMQRFNPKYKSLGKNKKAKGGPNYLWEGVSAEMQATLDRAKAKGAAMHIIGQSTIKRLKKAKISYYSRGTSEWLAAAMRYKIPLENMEVPFASGDAQIQDDYDLLPLEEKKRIIEIYEKTMIGMNRHYISSKNVSQARDAKYHKLKVIEVEGSNGIFILGEIVPPGKTKQVKLFKNDRSTFTNESDRETVAGHNGINAELAIKMNKPLHVFDFASNSWKTWSKEENRFVSELTPELTTRPLLLGRPRKYADKEQSDTHANDAIFDVFRKTFGYAAYSTKRVKKGLSISELNGDRQALYKKAKDYSSDFDGVEINKDNPQTKLNLFFSQQERKFRTEMMARDFSFALDDLVELELESIDDKVAEATEDYVNAKNGGNVEDIKAADHKLHAFISYKSDLEDESIARKAVLKHLTLEKVFDDMKESYRYYGEDSNPHIAEAYKKVLDNFDPLIQEALELVQHAENFRVVPYKSKESDKFEGEVTDSADKVQAEVADFTEDELGTKISGNDGWSFKIRFVDPKMTLSETTKKVLNNIYMLKPEDSYVKEKGNKKNISEYDKRATDDLGEFRFMNGEYAHAVLINELSGMIDADDFSVVDRVEDGITYYKFPALEKAKLKYPWVESVIDYLNGNSDYISAFFHDFNKDFIQYAKMDGNGKSMPLNRPVAQNSAYTTLVRNVEGAIILSDSSVYNTAGKYNRIEAKRLQDYIRHIEANMGVIESSNDLFDEQGDLNTDSFIYEAAGELTKVLRSLGFECSTPYIARNLKSLALPDDKGVFQLYNLLSSIKGILVSIANEKVKNSSKKSFTDDDNYLMYFNKELKNIAKIVGEVSELDNVQSFRDGDNTRYSYSAPNYISNLVKKIKSNSRRDKFLESEFKYDEFYFHDGEWQNEWLKNLAGNEPENDYYRGALELSEVISVTAEVKGPLDKEVSVPFADWTPEQTYNTLISKYFGRDSAEGEIQLADYNMPIFSDSPVCMFITGKKYKSSNQGTFKEKLTPLYRRLVLQEMRRIKTTNKKIATRENATPEEIKANPGLAEIQSYDEEDCHNGTKFNFFSELNNFKIDKTTAIKEDQVGKDFTEAVQELIDSGNMDDVNEFIDRCMNTVLDDLFQDFVSDIDILKMTSNLTKWGVIKSEQSSKRDENGKLDFDPNPTLNALEEYFWNSTYASSQIIQMTASDLAFYKNAIDFQKRYKEVYAAGNRLNTNAKYGRKVENTIYIKDQYVTSSSYLGIKEALKDAVKAGRMKQEQYEWTMKQYKEINIADAQAYRSPESFKSILSMAGKWNDDIEESFQRIKNNEWDYKDFSVVWQTIKPFMFTNVKTPNGLGGNLRVPHQNKNSEFLVLTFFQMVAADSKNSPFLKGIGEFFDKNPGIDLIQFESAVKAGGQGKVDLFYNEDKLKFLLEDDNKESLAIKVAAQEVLKDKYDTSTTEEKLKAGMDYLLDNGGMTQQKYNDMFKFAEQDSDDIVATLTEAVSVPTGENGELKFDLEKGIFDKNVIHQLSYDDYMIAQPTPEHLVDIANATSGSQFRNLINANLTDKNFKIKLRVKSGAGHKFITLNKQQMMDLYQGAIVDNLLDSFEDTSGVFEDIHSLQKYLYQSIQGNPKFGTDVIDALKIVKITDPLDSTKTKEVFNLPPDLPTITNQVQELCTSLFSNRVTKQKINGGNCIQVACTGLSRNLNIVRDEEGNLLGAECMLPSWSKKFYSKFLVNRTTSNGKRYQALDIEKMKRTNPDLLKMVGYRIPTENKYSMLPLLVKGFLPQQNGSAIMLPADITLIAGSDFDVDKMFLRIPSFEIGDDGSPRKIEYNISSKSNEDTRRMTKKQRDNLMIDIEYAVLTSKEGSEQLFKPGNYNTLKKEAKVLRIINNPYLLKKFVKVTYPSYTEDKVDMILNSQSAILELFRKPSISVKVLEKFLNDYSTPINPLTPTSYNYFHKQNMTGAALIGLYANGSSMHTKAQQTGLVIAEGEEFMVNGKSFKSMHNILNPDDDYIQDIIAEFQAASVDNVKDPVLADLNQSTSTAGLALLMARVGMNIEEIALMFNATKIPFFETDSDYFNKNFEFLFKMNPADYKKKYLNTEIVEKYSITSEKMLAVSMFINEHPELAENMNSDEVSPPDFLAQAIEEGVNRDELKSKILDIFILYDFYQHIKSLSSSLKDSNNILKADSPNNSIDIALPGAVQQIREVYKVGVNMSAKSFPFRTSEYNEETGEYTEKTAEHTIEDFVSNDIIDATMDREEKRKRLLERNLPTIQSFYSLGIELPIQAMNKYFIQGSPLVGLGNNIVPGVLGEIMNNSDTGNMNKKDIKDYYREYMQYVLSTTKLFGENFDIKRQYYLTEFPAKARKLIKANKELQQNALVSRLKIELRNSAEADNITYQKSSKLTPEMKATIRMCLNNLLYSKNPMVVQFGVDLFKYSYYKDGFNYGPNSFGTYFDATFWNCFPEVMNTLRSYKDSKGEDPALLYNFKNQYLANHVDDTKDNIIFRYRGRDKAVPDKKGILHLRAGNCYSKYAGGYVTYLRFAVDDNDFRLYTLDPSSVKYGTKPDDKIRYVPFVVFDEYQPVYNAQSNVKEMAKLYFNNRKLTIKNKELAEQEENKAAVDAVTDDSEAPSIDEMADQMLDGMVVEKTKKPKTTSPTNTKESAEDNQDEELLEKNLSVAERILAAIKNGGNNTKVDNTEVDNIEKEIEQIEKDEDACSK